MYCKKIIEAFSCYFVNFGFGFKLVVIRKKMAKVILKEVFIDSFFI